MKGLLFFLFLAGEANVCYKIENDIIVMCFRQRFRIKQVVIYQHFIFVKFSSAPIVHLSSNVVHLTVQLNIMMIIDCSANNQLPDSDISIGDATKKALAQLKPERRKPVLLGICAFYITSVTYLQSHLPLQNTLLKALGCLNPLKREKASSWMSAIFKMSGVFILLIKKLSS